MFYKNRPIVKIEKTEFDRLLDWFTIILLTIYFLYVYMNYQQLPETIPTHFGANGVADDFGSKNSIWLLPIIAIITTIGMRILIKFPHQFNYLVKITEENAHRQYQFGTRIIRFSTLFIVLLFFYISYATIKATQNTDEHTLGTWFLPTVILSSIIFPIYLLLKMNSLK